MTNDLIALLRTGWQGVVASVVAYFVAKGVDINTDAAFAATWPIVMFLYYGAAQAAATFLPRGVTRVLMGPGSAPNYEEAK